MTLETRPPSPDTPSMDWSHCPLVEVIPGKVSGAALVRGTRLPADTVLDNAVAGLSEPEISEQFDVPVRTVKALLSYAKSRHASVRSL